MGMKKSILAKLLFAVMMTFVAMGMMQGKASAADSAVKKSEIKKWHDIPPYQYKDVFATETVKIQGITVVDESGKSIEKSIRFKIFNCTKQEVEGIIESQNGVLPELNLIKNHNYIIFAYDSEYKMDSLYIWVKGNQIVDIKKNADTYAYPQVNSLQLSKRATPVSDPESDYRIITRLNVLYGSGNMYNVKFKLVSAFETIEGTSGNSGRLNVELLEDVTYMVTVESDKYGVETFPIAFKDKSEYGGARYTYDHSDCHKVDDIQLVNKQDAHKNDIAIESISGNTVISGFNFKDLIIFEKKLDKSTVSGMDGKDYDVVDIKAVNPHRWEVSKLAAGEYRITEKVDRQVDQVYYIDGEGKLQPVKFEKDGNKVIFTMNSLSLYPVVLEYDPANIPVTETKTENGNDDTVKVDKTVKVKKVVISGISKKIAAGKKIQLTAKVTPANASNKAVKWTTSNKKYASVTSKGKVTVKKAGIGKTVTITAKAKDGSGKKATYKIKIMKNAVKKINLTAKKSVKAGKKVTVKASVKTTGKNANKTLKWSTTNKKYATVTSKGKVTTKKSGKGKTVKITAKATDGSGKKKTIKIKIK